MASAKSLIDWDHLKPRIFQHLADGKSQKDIRKSLAEDSDHTFRVSISKSQLETQLKHWKYRRSLHEPEWKVVSHRINKRRKAGKPSSQVVVNGFILSETQVIKAIRRYDTPTLIPRLPSPQIPSEFSHHLIEVRTPPLHHRSLQTKPFSVSTAAKTTHRSVALYLKVAGRGLPQTAQWRKVELSIAQFVGRYLFPTYENYQWFREAFNTLGHEPQLAATYQHSNASTSYSGQESLVPYRTWEPLPRFHDVATIHRNEIQQPSGRSPIHTAVVQTLLGLLYDLSNQSLDYTGHEILVSIMDSTGWDTVLPHLRDVLIGIDSNMMQAIAEGLFKESICRCHHKMLDLSIDLGADPTQRIQFLFDVDGDSTATSIATPLVGICKQSSQSSLRYEQTDRERLVLSLLRRDPNIPDISLLWIIRARFHAIAEDIIRSQPERAVNFAIAVCDLEEGPWLGFNTYDSVTPLMVAYSGLGQSEGKLSLIRCLLERDAKADLKAMIAAAGTGDGKVVSLLYQHGSPVNGFISELGTPLSSACNAAFTDEDGDWSAIPVLLELGASPDSPESGDINSWEHSPLHILALTDDRPLVTEALAFLLKSGADINHRTSLYCRKHFRDRPYDFIPGCFGEFAETALEYAIVSSHWISAIQLLSACCHLTGREMLFLYPFAGPFPRGTPAGYKYFGRSIRLLLARAPEQAAARHWDGRTVLQCAIQREHEEVILELFAFGVKPMPSDFMYMMSDRKRTKAMVCGLSSSIQMRLALSARSSQHSIIVASTIRLIFAYACPEVVRDILEGFPDVYDSPGLCYAIARIASKDRISYSSSFQAVGYEELQDDWLDVHDLLAFVSRRTMPNRHEDWESTAICMAARAGRVDILQILLWFGHENSRRSGFVPAFILKDFLIRKAERRWSSRENDEQNTDCLGIWIEYCRMDDPIMRCSPLTAAAMVVPESAAVEAVNLLLAQGYHPDGWTVLIASRRGYLSILQRLKQLDSWPHILNHDDKPEWCPTALQMAVYHGCVSTARLLLDTRSAIDAVDLCASRPLHFCKPDSSKSEKERIMPRTALQHAVDKENFELVDILVKAGANVNAPAAMNSGATALQIASIRGSILMVQYLLSIGADVHAEGAARHGRTALQGAAEHGRKDVVELLARHTALPGYQHRERLVNAVFYAKKNVQHVVARILRESVFPPWGPEDEKTINMLEEDWESSSGNSEYSEWQAELRNWKETFDDWSESSQGHESSSISTVMEEELHVELPAASQEDESLFPEEMEWRVEDLGGFDFRRNSEIDSHAVDISQWLTFAEDDTTWLDLPMGLEGYGDDQALFDDFP